MVIRDICIGAEPDRPSQLAAGDCMEAVIDAIHCWSICKADISGLKVEDDSAKSAPKKK